MAIPKGEINAVIEAMTNAEITDETTNEEIAIRIIEALSSVRDLTKTYVAVSQQRLNEMDPWSTFAIGPFSTENKAKLAGEGMAGRPGAPGYGHWKVAVLLPTAAQTWKVLTEIEDQKGDRFKWVAGVKKKLDASEWNKPEGRGSW